MPRISKKRGKFSAFRGISHHKECILSAVDETDQIIFEIYGLGPETKEKADKMISYFEKDDHSHYLISDMKQCYRDISETIGRMHDEIKSDVHTSEKGHSLAELNALHSEIKLLYQRYQGLSIRHLQGYLDFFCLYKKIKYSINEIQKQAIEAYMTTTQERCNLRVKDISLKEIPVDLFEAYGDYHFGCFAV